MNDRFIHVKIPSLHSLQIFHFRQSDQPSSLCAALVPKQQKLKALYKKYFEAYIILSLDVFNAIASNFCRTLGHCSHRHLKTYARMHALRESESDRGSNTPSTIDPILPIRHNSFIPSRNEVIMRILKISMRSICTLNSLICRLQQPISKYPQPNNKPKCTSTYRTQETPHNINRPDEIQQSRENAEDPEERRHGEVRGFLAQLFAGHAWRVDGVAGVVEVHASRPLVAGEVRAGPSGGFLWPEGDAHGVEQA